ncbi:MAG: SdiA-regulated domain-containing protein [Ignavibacteriales bacterium]|nr:SdiA-regulated domain-containing protein [Ignavibacteriales bacterium]
MKKQLVMVFLALLSWTCTRQEPGGGIISPAVTSLVQVAVYNIEVPEPSGLVYNSKNNTLMTVSDGNSTVYEIDFTGRILKSLVVPSSDMEGITLSSNCDTMYIAEETNQIITKYLINGTKLSSFPVNVATVLKHGPEGVTVDKNNHVFVLNEKFPTMILEYNQGKEVWRKEINFTLDCSDIFYESSTDCFWIVSDESMRVIKMSRSGDLLGSWSVPFTKGEGLAIVQNKIYIVNDAENKMYVFDKPI